MLSRSPVLAIVLLGASCMDDGPARLDATPAGSHAHVSDPQSAMDATAATTLTGDAISNGCGGT